MILKNFLAVVYFTALSLASSYGLAQQTGPLMLPSGNYAASGANSDITSILNLQDLQFNQSGGRNFDFQSRSGVSWPVPLMQPLTSPSVIAFDLAPLGNPTEIGGSGITWADFCNEPQVQWNAAFSCAHMGVGATYVAFGSHSFVGAAPLPVRLEVGGSLAQYLDASGNVAIGLANSNPADLLDTRVSDTTAYHLNSDNLFTPTVSDVHEIYNSNNSAAFAGMLFKVRATNQATWSVAAVYTANALSYLAFRGRNGSTTSTEVLDIYSGGTGFVGGGLLVKGSAHVEYTGTTPTFGSGFGTSPSIVGNDHVGRITVGTGGGTAGAIVMSTNWTNNPICFAQDETTSNIMRATATGVAGLTITGVMVAGDNITYDCDGYQ